MDIIREHCNAWLEQYDLNMPQPSHQVIGEARVIYDGAGNKVAATGNGTVVFFNSQNVEIGDIVSIEVVLKERKP